MARILFVQNFWFEYLGTMVLSSYLKEKGHQVDLVVDNDQLKIIDYVNMYKPDIVGAYVISGSHNWILSVFKKIKKETDTFTIMGGPHPTFFPDVVRAEGLDAICIGEGEDALLELAEKINDRNEDFYTIRNLWIKKDGDICKNSLRPLISNLNSLPFPDRELYYKYPLLRRSPSKHFITGRGCPFNCSFCCNKAYKDLYKGLGTMVRRPDPEKVCGEIETVRDKYPLKSIRFDDEVFLLEPEWLLEFLKVYEKRIHLPFSCLIRADLTTEKLVSAMKKAGCYIAYFGIESGVDKIRNDILGKNISRRQIKDTAYLLRKYHIKIGTFNMVGMPGESFDDAWETVKLNQEIKSDYPWCSIIQPYPGTDLERYAKLNGYLDPEYGVDDLTQSYFNDTVLENKDSQSLVALQKLFYLAVKYPFLSPLIKKAAIKGGNTFWARWIFNLTYAYRYAKTYKLPFWDLFQRALLWKDNF